MNKQANMKILHSKRSVNILKKVIVKMEMLARIFIRNTKIFQISIKKININNFHKILEKNSNKIKHIVFILNKVIANQEKVVQIYIKCAIFLKNKFIVSMSKLAIVDILIRNVRMHIFLKKKILNHQVLHNVVIFRKVKINFIF